MYLNPSLSSPFPPIPIQNSVPGVKTVDHNNLSLLNSPIFPEAIPDSIKKIKETINLLCERIKALDAHTGLFLLSHYCSAPRLNYLMRSSPTFYQSPSLIEIDDIVREAATAVTNVTIEKNSWRQASLPTRFGGLGIRRVETLALPCYISSLTKSLDLIRQILPQAIPPKPSQLINAEQVFSTRHPGAKLPTGDLAERQRAWDESICHDEFNNLSSSANQIHNARLLAAATPHSGAWIHALPIPELGLHMDAESIRVAVALRLGAPVCEPHRCRCGTLVDRLGHHGLACHRSLGRLPRHSHLNDIVKRALATAGIPAWLEPAGLDSTDGRRPDGVTVFPFRGGKSLCWDATCVDTFCQTAIGETAHSPGAAANKAEAHKRSHYASLSGSYVFEPVAIETSGVFGKSTSRFISELGHRLTGVTGDKREVSWLRQRLSMAVMRGNAASIKATGTLST